MGKDVRSTGNTKNRPKKAHIGGEAREDNSNGIGRGLEAVQN